VSTLDFRVLGPLEVWRDGALVAIPAPKQRALLSLFLLRANEAVPQDELIDQIWGEDAPESARASLQNQIHALRKILGPAAFETIPTAYRLSVDPGTLDLACFDRLVSEAGSAQAEERAEKLRDALSLWRGPPLAEFRTEPFAQQEIERLDGKRLTALEERIDAELQLGLHATLVAELEYLTVQHPLRERFWAQLMLALYRAGRQADALATYRRAHHAFVDELGIEPGVVLRELQRAILVQDPALTRDERRLGSTLERAAALLSVGPRERAESLVDYGIALAWSGKSREAWATIEAAARLAASVGERGVEERALLLLSTTKETSLRDYLVEAQQAAERFRDLDDNRGLCLALREQSWVLRELGDASGALEAAEQVARAAVDSGNGWEQARASAMIAFLLAHGPTPVAEAIVRCNELLPPELWRDRSPFLVWSALAFLHAQAASIADARALLAQAMPEARRAATSELFFALLGAAEVEDTAGNLDASAGPLREAYALAESDQHMPASAMSAAELSCLLARKGDTDEAAVLAQVARQKSSPDAFRNGVLWRRALARLAAGEQRIDEALRLIDEAVDRACAADWLTFRGETLEDAADVRELARDEAGLHAALVAALAAYEQKGNVVGSERVQRRLVDTG